MSNREDGQGGSVGYQSMGKPFFENICGRYRTLTSFIIAINPYLIPFQINRP